MQVLGSDKSEKEGLDELLAGLTAPLTRAELVALQSDDEKEIQKLKTGITVIEQRMTAREVQISKIDEQERNEKIDKYKKMMEADGITIQAFAQHVGITTVKTATKAPAAKTTGEPKAEKADLPVKYRNPETGETWTGRGKPVLSIKLKRIKYRNPANPSETWHGWEAKNEKEKEEFGPAPAWYTPDLPAQTNAAGKDLYPDSLLLDNQ